MQTKVKNPRKQRKRIYNAPAHIRHKLMAAPLSKEIAEKQGTKTMPVRKGDTVRIQRGDNKGFEGKISRVDMKNYRIYIEGLTREKVDGTNIFLPVHPSKVMIKNLNLNDKKRKAVIERKKPIEKNHVPKTTQKPTLTNKPKPKPKIFVIEKEETKETAAVTKPAVKKVSVAKKSTGSKSGAKPKTPKTDGGQ
jgi:large subunit ribosomal protein L24